jgi:O-antigen ligase
MNAFFEFGVLVCIYFLVVTNAYTPGRIRTILGTLSICALIMAVLCIIAFHTGFMADQLLHEARDEFTPRRAHAFGILEDANDFAQFLLVGLAGLGVFWRKRHLIGNMALLTAPAILIVYAIFLTGSRGAMFGLAVLVFTVMSSRAGKLQSFIVAGTVFAALLGSQFGGGREISVNEGSAAGRVMAWGTGISMLKSHPLFGVGFQQFAELNPLTAHNSFVLCFAELGLFGYFFWLAMLVTVILGLQRLSRLPVKTPEDESLRGCVTTLRAAFYSFLVTSWFLSRTYNVTFYLLTGMAAALIYATREKSPVTTVGTERWVAATLVSQVASLLFVYATVRLRGL